MLVGIIAGLLILVGTSYAWWTSTASQTGINEVQSSCIKVAIQNEENNIKLQNAYPLTDKQAEELTPYKFTITNTCKTIVDYTVKLEKLLQPNGQEKDLLKSEYIAVEFNGGQKELLSNYPIGKTTYDGSDYTSKEARELIKGTLNGNDTKTYTIKLWMDESVTATDDSMNKSFISKIVVDGSLNELAKYNEPKLHGADPVLGNEGSNEEVAMLSTLEEAEPTTNDKLIPVVIDNKGTVTRANLAHEWYNYEEKRWANAVILVDGTKEPEVGAEIPETSIESYFVWIPKYSYKLFNVDNFKYEKDGEVASPQIIQIRFGTTETNDNNKNECTTPKTSGNIGQCQNGDWMTHPAFLAFEGTTGLWVGKFETGYSGAENTSGAQHNENQPDKVIIKPNVYVWTNIQVAKAYQTSYEYQRNLESHMMKNTEWGAVAYLTQSIYGRCNNENGTIKCEEARINNSSNFVTGVVAINQPTTGYPAYTNYGQTNPGEVNNKSNVYPSSVEASTTKNNTGIFDMSGGAWEYVMAVMKDEEGSPASGRDDLYNSGFNGTLTNSGSDSSTKEVVNGLDFPEDTKYYGTYEYSKSYDDYQRGILGDATREMGPFKDSVYKGTSGETQPRHVSGWYEDEAFFVFSYDPWVIRGGESVRGLNAGLFAFLRTSGNGDQNRTFRITLAIR